MKASYMLPSGTYNLILSPDDLQVLLLTGIVRAPRTFYDIPCITSRAYWDCETNDMKHSEKQEVFNDVCFRLDEPVADIKPGIHNIQFLNIIIEKKE